MVNDGDPDTVLVLDHLYDGIYFVIVHLIHLLRNHVEVQRVSTTPTPFIDFTVGIVPYERTQDSSEIHSSHLLVFARNFDDRDEILLPE